ncbi:MAG: hypothetical protein IK079_00675, partial [Desulfovibrio sp.]|nr:hypothetical protein [Desulfovibrio sp.]
MKTYQRLAPFAPDQSGAISALYEFNGLLIVLDAGGCTGNICGFDEPRWAKKKAALVSAGLRDMDAILGRDEALLQKTADCLNALDCDFVAFIGTPVPAVIGTDLFGLARMAKNRFGKPALAIPTTGTKY